ncbi:hypothetical protein ACFL2Q_17295 [Thermodesulfobacteriota bacterium]
MGIRNIMPVLIAIVFAVTFGFTPGAFAGNLQFMPLKDTPKATGTIQLGKDSLKISANGLKADSVYTVWFVNKKPKMQKAGAGNAPYMFKTDSAGKGSYDASLSASPFGKWGMVMVVRHPTGNPKDMDNKVGAFAAKIPKTAR